MTPGGGYRPELDGIRGLAVLLVIVSHAGLGRGGGAVGVTLFFVLSGYLITGILLRGFTFRDFYARRVRRLAPALLAVLAATGLLMAALGRFEAYPGQMFAALAYAANFARADGADLGFLEHTWSLALEEQFYLVWPFAVLLLGRKVGWLAVAGIIGVVVLRAVTPATPAELALPWLRADAVLAGCALAVWDRRPNVAWLGLAIIPALLVEPSAWALTAATVGSVALVASAERVPLLRHRWLVRAGEISYGLYLWHLAPVFLLGWVGVPIAFALALASERYVERPWRLRRHEPVGEIELRPHLAGRAGLRPVHAEDVVRGAVVH